MQSIFKRYEEKYLVSREQGKELQKVLSRHMEPDSHGDYLVQNLYYDDGNWSVVRASVEKPLFKEKLRLRCYGMPGRESQVFLELKKKYQGVVYKRRIAIPFSELSRRSMREIIAGETSQIAKELEYYMRTNDVSERVHLAYHRTAFSGIEDIGLRVTFDTEIHFRLDNLCYSMPDEGFDILGQNKILIEVKTLGGMPLWLAKALSANGVYPMAFSKYGTCYTNHVLAGAEAMAIERKVLSGV
jgi:SPX domain protein involved in polyphosphate accumulation